MQPFHHAPTCLDGLRGAPEFVIRFRPNVAVTKLTVTVEEQCPMCLASKLYAREEWRVDTALRQFTRSTAVWLTTFLHRRRVALQGEDTILSEGAG